MTTYTINNFGAGEVNFKGYVSGKLCVLNGVFTFDPDNAAYQSATRLEITLPSDFPMKKSAISSAILMSGTGKVGTGTPIRCHIEGGKLCFEKLSIYDSYGPMTIIVASAFVTRGYRGSFTDSKTTQVSFRKLLVPDSNYCYALVKDEYISMAVVFEDFPRNYELCAPVSVPINNFPTDIDVEIPICVQGNYDAAKPGSLIVIARIQNGHLHYVVPADVNNFGGQGTFTTIFATRGTYIPSAPVAGEFGFTAEDMTADAKTQITKFEFKTNTGLGALIIDADLKTTAEENPFLMTKENVSDSEPYSALAILMGRSKDSDNYRLTPCEFSWSKFHKVQTFEFPIDNANIKLDNEFFGTYLFHTITF